jgi:hypothetical protein
MENSNLEYCFAAKESTAIFPGDKVITRIFNFPVLATVDYIHERGQLDLIVNCSTLPVSENSFDLTVNSSDVKKIASDRIELFFRKNGIETTIELEIGENGFVSSERELKKIRKLFQFSWRYVRGRL